MRAYYYDNLPGDQRLPHDYIFSRPVLDKTLEALGVKYWSVPVDNYQAKLDAIAKERGYKYRDVMNVSKEGLGDVSPPLWEIATQILINCVRTEL
jgi:1,2-dihydroxy-3-keto-5-methylthiopentene dioxygenase